MVKPLWIGTGLLLGLLAVGVPVAIAQDNAAFPPNPLESKEPDSLLPAQNRPLTAQEQKQLAAQLNQLDAQAQQRLATGDRVGAFETWNRELRLRRVLGPLAELEALGRVGDIAWKENEQPEVRWITKRLDAIWAELQAEKAPKDPVSYRQRMEGLGWAYQQVRQPETAIAVYQQVLADARERRDTKKIDATLNALGQLHLGWFDYTSAATVYQELLERAKAAGDRTNELVYLTQLAYAHEQAKQPDLAIPYLQQLVERYQAAGNLTAIAPTQIRIGDNYQQMERPDLAEQNYQAAYQLAYTQLQFAYASDALSKLGDLYQRFDRLDAALRVYDFLVGVERQAYSTYGVMMAYDKLGKVHLARKEYPQAIAAFRQGLALAKQLKYREDAFTDQIQQASQAVPQ